MIESLSGLFDALRAQGVAVSPAEAIDAVRALAAVGVEARDDVRAALRAACAKDRSERVCFDLVFERWYAGPSRVRRGSGDGSEAGPSGAGRGRSGELQTALRPPTDALRPDAVRAYRPLARPGEKRSPQAGARPLVERLREQARRPGERLKRVVLQRAGAPGRTAQERIDEARGGDARRRDWNAPSSQAGDRELARQAARLIAELRLSDGRRWRRGRRGRFAARATLRASMATGGVPFFLRHQRRRRRRARVVVLLDVSWSAARAAGLFLLMAARFFEAATHTRVFAFVDRPVECTREIFAWARSGGRGELSAVLRTLNGLDLQGASDFGRTFFALQDGGSAGSHCGLRRDSVLVVLGDGRSNRNDPLVWAFAELARRAAAVVWLVPEAPARWGTGDSALAGYLPHTDVVIETTDLAGLARGLAEVRRAVEA